MLLMLDTDICSYIIKQHPRVVLETLQSRAESGDEIVISSVTYAELLYGAERSGNTAKHRRLINALVERLADVMPWDRDAAEAFARLKARLAGLGTPIGPNDTMIAGHAISKTATLVTNNQKHFSKVKGLKIENWVG